MLSLRDVSAGYGSFQALTGVSLEVRTGEAVAVIGPNGAGKTTLMRVVSGLLPTWSGELSFEGRPLSEIPRHKVVDAGIAHVPEHRRLFPGLTAEENLMMGAYNERGRGRFRERLDEVYALFPRLRERRNQIAGTLSGGEQQMCAIGRAIMSEPRLLLLDEPSAGLAPLVVKQVFDLIQHIRAEGYTVLIVEQNVYQVLRVASRAYLLETGAIRASGSAEEFARSDEVRRAYMGI